MADEGKQTFRFDTFGDESFWGDTLRLHEAIEGQKLGGVGPGVSPATALAVGLKVDVDALPASVIAALREGKVDLNDPATTLLLLKAGSVVGLTGHFNSQGRLSSIGIQCALCHSTVDDSFAPGIGHRLDGWANRDLNVGAITSLAPNLQPAAALLGTDVATVRKVLAAWGPGKFDAELFMDGKGALQFYQLAIPAPKPPKGSFDEGAAERGKELFAGQAKCATCHVPPLFTEPGWNLHTPEEIGVDDFQASRAPDKRYRTPPLKGLWTHTKGGYFHDGRFSTLGEVVQHYNGFFGLGLSDQQLHDLVEYLKSL